MLVSWKWLQRFVDLGDIGADEGARRLTLGGLQVEGVTRQADALAGVVVGRILTREPHPQADRLGVCEVDVGTGVPRTIVCGAPNARAGMFAPVALPGAVVAGRAIAPVEMRGVPSDGMLCSAKELGLGDGHEGLLDLGTGIPGAALSAHLDHDDVILDLSVTPNRGDALSMIGVARDLAALLGRPLRRPEITLPPAAGADSGTRVSLEIADPVACPRYAFAIVDGVQVAPSPAWLRARLEAIGQRSINNVVDVTNWVLFELGQPLHAFDLDRLRGQRILVRKAAPGEPFVSLDGLERALDEGDTVIADAEGPVALAGVMGGANSEIHDGSTRVLIECAAFDPRAVRRTARRLGMRTESSYRFERGVDVEQIPYALQRAVELIAATQPEGVAVTMAPEFVDQAPGVPPRRRIVFDTAMVPRVLGMDVASGRTIEVLRSLGLVVRGEAGTVEVEVPHVRSDLERPIDLVEEVARIEGFDALPSLLPPGIPGVAPARRDDAPVAQHVQPIVDDAILRAVRDVRSALVRAGVSEAVTWGFGDPDAQHALLGDVALVRLRNPLGAETGAMRRTLLAGLLDAVAYNRARNQPRVALFEVGHAFPPGADGDRVPEPQHVALVLTGVASPRWTDGGRRYDLADAVGVMELVGEAAGRPLQATSAAEAPPWAHPMAVAHLVVGDVVVGTVAALHPAVAARWGIDEPVYAAELVLSELLAQPARERRYQRIPRTPGARRDAALLVDSALPFAAIRAIIEGVREERLAGFEVFDVYAGAGVPAGKRSIALRFELRGDDTTLTDEQIEAASDRLVDAVCTAVGATRR